LATCQVCTPFSCRVSCRVSCRGLFRLLAQNRLSRGGCGVGSLAGVKARTGFVRLSRGCPFFSACRSLILILSWLCTLVLILPALGSNTCPIRKLSANTQPALRLAARFSLSAGSQETLRKHSGSFFTRTQGCERAPEFPKSQNSFPRVPVLARIPKLPKWGKGFYVRACVRPNSQN
jgi:hypothetical protein